jgi:hypothetical protein
VIFLQALIEINYWLWRFGWCRGFLLVKICAWIVIQKGDYVPDARRAHSKCDILDPSRSTLVIFYKEIETYQFVPMHICTVQWRICYFEYPLLKNPLLQNSCFIFLLMWSKCSLRSSLPGLCTPTLSCLWCFYNIHVPLIHDVWHDLIFTAVRTIAPQPAKFPRTGAKFCSNLSFHKFAFCHRCFQETVMLVV